MTAVIQLGLEDQLGRIFASLIMPSTLLFVLAFIALVFAQTRPNIDDNFSADVTIIESRETHKIKMNVTYIGCE